MAIAWACFSILIIVLELYTGCAIIGWAGDNMVVHREKSPGPYWFTITLHLLIGIGLPLLFIFAQ